MPRTGGIKLNFPDLEPHEMEHSCALDIADMGGLTLMDAGILMNITRERIRQIEESIYLVLGSTGLLDDMIGHDYHPDRSMAQHRSRVYASDSILGDHISEREEL